MFCALQEPQRLQSSRRVGSQDSLNEFLDTTEMDAVARMSSDVNRLRGIIPKGDDEFKVFFFIKKKKKKGEEEKKEEEAENTFFVVFFCLSQMRLMSRNKEEAELFFC